MFETVQLSEIHAPGRSRHSSENILFLIKKLLYFQHFGGRSSRRSLPLKSHGESETSSCSTCDKGELNLILNEGRKSFQYE